MKISNTFVSALMIGGLFLGLGTAAQADNVVADDGASLASYFSEEGIEFDQTKDDVGDPKFKVNYYGTDFSIFFYGCEDGRKCNAIQFSNCL